MMPGISSNGGSLESLQRVGPWKLSKGWVPGSIKGCIIYKADLPLTSPKLLLPPSRLETPWAKTSSSMVRSFIGKI